MRQHFEGLKAILRPSIASGEVQAAESLLRLRAKNGGGPDCYSADNSQAIYGANADCLVVDELSRIPAAAWPACLTTVTGASSCRIRTVLNLELGGKDWAIRIILRFQQMSEKERGNASEDFLMFGPDSSFVSAEIIELMRANMPRHLWEALYEGVIPSDDTSPLDALGRSLFTQKDEMVNLGGMVAIAIGLQTNGQLG